MNAEQTRSKNKYIHPYVSIGGAEGGIVQNNTTSFRETMRHKYVLYTLSALVISVINLSYTTDQNQKTRDHSEDEEATHSNRRAQ
jgi:hypothetical protein